MFLGHVRGGFGRWSGSRSGVIPKPRAGIEAPVLSLNSMSVMLMSRDGPIFFQMVRGRPSVLE